MKVEYFPLFRCNLDWIQCFYQSVFFNIDVRWCIVVWCGVMKRNVSIEKLNWPVFHINEIKYSEIIFIVQKEILLSFEIPTNLSTHSFWNHNPCRLTYGLGLWGKITMSIKKKIMFIRNQCPPALYTHSMLYFLIHSFS